MKLYIEREDCFAAGMVNGLIHGLIAWAVIIAIVVVFA